MTDVFGRNVPAGNEAPDVPAAFAAFSMSAPPGPLTVSSRAEANAVWIAYTSAVGEANAKPLHVWRSDINQEERRVGSSWEYVAGRQHGATVHFGRTGVSAGGVGLLHATSLQRASQGWAINGNAWLVVPQTGFYMLYAAVNVSGAASTLGRQNAQFSIRNGSGILGREGISNENNYSVGAVLAPLTQGNEIQIQVHHESGGTRDYTATLQIAMINAPNW